MEKTFNIILEYQGNEYSVEIEDPYLPIKDLTNMILNAFEIPKFDVETEKVFEYRLGRIVEEEEQVLYPIVKGEEKNLMDYGVKPGDYITLTVVPDAA